MKKELNLVGQVKRVLQQFHAKKVLIAVSGGVDSMVLTDVVQRIWPHEQIGVVNVDHDLRPESRSETAFVKQYCQDHQINFYTAKWNHNHSDVGMEAVARQFRYDFFAEIMETGKFDTLLTAHHANDLSENILMKLVRSGNVYEVTSLKSQRPFASGQLLRPLLSFSKADIQDFAVSHKIAHVQDETNFEDITMRNRLRNHIFPELQSENGQLLPHFELFNQQLCALIKLADQKFSEIEFAMNLTDSKNSLRGLLKPVLDLDADQQSLFWGSLFTRRLSQVYVSNKQIQQIISIVAGDQPNASINLEDGWVFERSYDEFVIHQDSEFEGFELSIELDHKYQLGDRVFSISESTPEQATFSTENMPKHIVLRTRHDGDRLTIGLHKHQKLSKRFINEKIPSDERQKLAILLMDNEIVWVEKIYNIGEYLKKRSKFFKIDFDEV